MRVLPRICLSLSLAAAMLLSHQAKAVAADKLPYTEQKLANGLDVVLMKSTKVPLTTIVLTFKAGAMTETPDINGLTHLWEHMFFKGNARLPNQEAFNARIRELGIVYNGDTSAEKVRYYITLPSVFTEQGIQFIADAIATPLLEQGELERERLVVLNEYDRNASQPRFDLYRLTRKMIYDGMDYLRDPLGDRHVIETATREQLLRIKREVFNPANAALLVAGDFDEAKLIAAIKRDFGSWENPKDWKPITPPAFPAFPASQDVVMTNDKVRSISLSYEYRGPKARTEPKDSYAADILISLLNLRSGKFYQKYVESGLSTYAGLNYYTQSQVGEISLFAETSPESFGKLRQALAKEPEQWLKPDYFTKTQLEDVRRSLNISHKLEVNKPSEFIKTLAFWWAVTGLDYYASYKENLRQISLDDVRAFVRKYLINKPRITSVFLSPADAAKLGLKDNSAPLMQKYFPTEKKTH